MNKVILHIPHSSIEIPTYKGYTIDFLWIQDEILKLTDWYTNELFNNRICDRVVTPFSRVFCDVERFPVDDDEPMIKFGQGLAYTKRCDGSEMRKIDDELMSEVRTYYNKHHIEFESKVERQLSSNGYSLIIDCHSFPNEIIKCSLDKSTDRPDICIGSDEFHTPKLLVKITKDYFEKRGYIVSVNTPYSGSIVPLKYYQSNKNVLSMMIEINRKLYLKSGTNFKKIESFKNLKSDIDFYFYHLINSYLTGMMGYKIGESQFETILKYPDYWHPTLFKVAMNGEDIDEAYEQMKDMENIL